MIESEFRPTPFASRLVRHAMRDRARRETGSPVSPRHPSSMIGGKASTSGFARRQPVLSTKTRYDSTVTSKR